MVGRRLLQLRRAAHGPGALAQERVLERLLLDFTGLMQDTSLHTTRTQTSGALLAQIHTHRPNTTFYQLPVFPLTRSGPVPRLPEEVGQGGEPPLQRPNVASGAPLPGRRAAADHEGNRNPLPEELYGDVSGPDTLEGGRPKQTGKGTHVPLVRGLNKATLLCPGSCGCGSTAGLV